MLDVILDFIYGLLYDAIDILPDSPFLQFQNELNTTPMGADLLAYINYFVPVGSMLAVGTFYLGAVAFFYVARYLLKLARFI